MRPCLRNQVGPILVWDPSWDALQGSFHVENHHHEPQFSSSFRCGGRASWPRTCCRAARPG